MTNAELREETGLQELSRDPSLLMALGTGSLLTAFLLVAHSCCIGLVDQHLAPLLQICSFAG
ncbi:hypothetical protein K1718_15210 [Roseibium porphyridii]|uniref:Uncharacterized protein n=1 Tax=Roseibium porphyridii TaxID=2866279 RepID=A0ABY8EXM7_9HYPH|nr:MULTISPECIES: hypothetical protein [Stappiaceae]QFT32138.1 hypothetical protein FIV00_16730 [Labrenzia sp. THAF82]WFE87516.1 hypothetical protein K1718_15210 [Roseibium sp. KMA01]